MILSLLCQQPNMSTSILYPGWSDGTREVQVLRKMEWIFSTHTVSD